jgi:hypothetical protein
VNTNKNIIILEELIMTPFESLVVIVTVVTLAVIYTMIYTSLYIEAMRETDEEYCPSSEEDDE